MVQTPFCWQAEEDDVEENMRDEIPYEMETDFGVNDLPYLRVPIFKVNALLQTTQIFSTRLNRSIRALCILFLCICDRLLI